MFIEFHLQECDNLFAMLLLSSCLRGIVTEDVASSSFSVSYDNLLGMKVVSDNGVASSFGKHGVSYL
jgi:hypothetical protein